MIWLYALCGDEQYMLTYFLRHYAPECDKITLLDGGIKSSITYQIAEQYSNVRITLSPFSSTNYDDKLFTEYAQEKYKEARGKADWVIWVDVDEFLYSGKPLRETLDEYRRREIHAVKCEGVQMVAETFPESGGLLTDLVRVGAYDTIYNKTAAFDPMLNVRWSVGRHSVAIDGLEPTWTGLKLLHYRYFGDEWLRERNARNWARRSEQDTQTGRGYHCAPDNTGGRYSPEWYKDILQQGHEVI